MKNTLWKTWLGVAVLAVCGLTGAAVALGAGSASTKATATSTSTTAKPSRTPETPLTGDTLAKVKAAAIAKVGGTVDSATTENDSSNAAAVYEVHLTKADGSHVTVILDKDYNVLTVETGGPRGGHGHGGNGETALTGDIAAKAKAAALAKVGGTADAATTETDNGNAAAVYEVHVTKADGSHVTVILDKDYNVLTVETGRAGGGKRFGHRH
jgi:uncharacterized membrane protein YkoI